MEELLTYARLDRPLTELSLTTPDFPAWISDHVEDIQMVNPQREVAWRPSRDLPISREVVRDIPSRR